MRLIRVGGRTHSWVVQHFEREMRKEKSSRLEEEIFVAKSTHSKVSIGTQIEERVHH
jgi:hypothetical protein